jgi:hypothetical protein
MKDARTLWWLALSPILACGPAAVEEPGNSPESSDTSKGGVTAANGEVFGTGSAGLNVRQAPGTDSAVLGNLPDGTSVGIECQVDGQSVAGNTLWDFLPAHGGYVSDRFVYTGHDGRIPGVPDCNDSGGDDGGACEGLDFAGECAGDVLRWCEDDKLRTADCAALGKTCDYQSDQVGYNCVGGSSGGSGNGVLLTVTEIVGGDYSVSQDYGPSDFYGGYGYCQSYGSWGGVNVHCGVDISINYGTPLYVPADATVINAGGTGYFVDETNPAAGELKLRFGDGTEVVLGHMSLIDLYPGQAVSIGQYAGNSGTANGGHVHIEVRIPSASYASGFETVDPMSFFGW